MTERPAKVPVIYAMVLNPPSVVGSQRANMTGASMNVPVEDSLGLLRQLSPHIERVGVVFSRDMTGYLVRNAEAVARQQGLELVSREINSPKEAIQALNELQKEGIDALWILPDAALLDPKVIEYTILLSYRNSVPLLGLSERQARMGAILALSFASSEGAPKVAAMAPTGENPRATFTCRFPRPLK